MKGLKAFVFIAAVALTAPLFGAVDAFLKIDGIKGESQDSKHAGWIEVMSFSWSNQGATTAAARTNAAPSCASNEAKFSFKGAAGPQLMKAAVAHQPLQGVVIDFRGQTHVLQNAFVSSCQNNLMGDGSVTNCTLNFTRCTTHGGGANAASVLGRPAAVAAWSGPGDVNNAQLEIDGNSKRFHLVGLHFAGNQGTIILQGNGDGGFFRQAFQSKKKSGKVTVKTEYVTFTFKELSVTYVQRGSDGRDTFTLNFASADGPPAGFQQ